jgi:carboxymethylenebutenolidase
MIDNPQTEHDPTISIEVVQLRRLDAVVPAYAAWPMHPRLLMPSVVVVMHAWGVDATIREIVRRFAKNGIAAIAPDLYARFDAPGGDGVTDAAVFSPFAARLDRKQYDGDIRAAALWLTTKFANTKVGIAGFDLGGRIALIQAVDNSDVFSAVCSFYGPLVGVNPENLHIPVCASYGARDPAIAAEDVRLFRSELRVPNDVRIYNSAGHDFFDERRSAYVAAAAADAWKRTLDFFEKTLGQQRL